MSNEFKEFDTAPTLTFGELPETEKPTEVVPVEPEPVVSQEPALDDSVLSEEERKMVDDFSQKIDIHNSGAILQYVAWTQ